MDTINRTDKKVSPVTDLIYVASRNSAIGWMLFVITLVILVVQNIAIALSPKQVMASEDGVIVGQVVFNENRLRSNDVITGDVKKWVARCSSVNSITIYEDLSVCLTHMESKLAEVKLNGYEEMDYAPYIEAYGCPNTDIKFDQSTQVYSKDGQMFAEVYGDVICNIPGEKPTQQSFAYTIEGRIIPKTTAAPLGFKVSRYTEIE